MSDQKAPVAPPAPPAPEAPAAPISREDAMTAAFAEALKAEGIVKSDPPSEKPAETSAETSAKPPEEAPREEKPAEKEEPPPSDSLKRSFEKLAKEKEALRKEADTIKPYMEMLKAIPPHSLQALARAAQSGDPMALLTAAGYSYADVARRVVEGGNAAPRQEQPKPEQGKGNSLPPEIQNELTEMRSYIQRQQHQELLQSAKAAVPERFKYVKELGMYDAVLKYASDFTARTGSPPGETFGESIAIAAEAVEAHLAQEAQRWSKVLTPAQTSAQVASGAGRTSPQSTGSSAPVPKTITNSAAAPAPAKPEPRTRDEILRELENDPKFLESL